MAVGIDADVIYALSFVNSDTLVGIDADVIYALSFVNSDTLVGIVGPV